MKSGRLYSLVTKYWARIAAGLVVTIGLIELVAGGQTADSGLEFYLVVWAGTTGGLWFLFERAEQALSSESRQEVADRLGGIDLAPSLKAIPDQFPALFDSFFGERHFTVQCLRRSAICSGALFGITLVLLSILSFDRSPLVIGASLPSLLAVVLAIVTVNILPDYLSLLQTRLLFEWAAGDKPSIGLGPALIVDGLVTLVFGIFGVLGAWIISLVGALELALLTPVSGTSSMLALSSLASAFFTSLWLWLYVASVLVSRLLLKMNSGVGFLLRVTDVENQPFRSMGFVSVLIVSGLFLLGLPLVLL